MCFDRNINGNRDVKFLIGIIGHCTDQRKLLYYIYVFGVFFRLVKFKENSKNVVTTSVPNSMKIFKSSRRVAFPGTPMIWQRS